MSRYVDIESFINQTEAEILREEDSKVAACKLVMLYVIKDIPVADVAPVKHGEWVQTDIFKCSECGYSFEPEGYTAYFNYCPNCGAKMDGKVGGENV